MERLAPRSTDPAWQPRAAWDRVDLLTLSRRSDEELPSALRGSPMRRTKVQGLRRNIAVAVANAAMGSDTVSDPRRIGGAGSGVGSRRP